MSSHTEKEKVEREIALDSLVMDENLQVRTKLDDATIQKYVGVIKSGMEMPAISVARVDQMYMLVDGWHRVAAYRFIGLTKIKAVVVEATRSEARWLAADANLRHGLPLKNKEIQSVFKAYINARKHFDERGAFKSYRQIGRELGKTHHTIVSWTQRFFPTLAAKMGAETISYKDFPQPPDEPSNFAHEIRQSLEDAFDAFQATSDPDARSEIILYAEVLVGRMKGSGGYTLPDF